MKTRGRLYLAAVAVFAGLATHGTYAGTGDEPHYLAIAHSIAFDFDLDPSNNYGASEPLVASGTLEPGEHARTGAGGVLRPVHDVRMPLLFAPYVRVMKPAAAALARGVGEARLQRWRLTPSVLYRHTISAAMIALTGVLALILFDVLSTLGVPERAAFWTTLLVMVSPPFLVFSLLFFTEIVSAVLCLAVFRKIVLDREAGTAWSWAVAGAATGFLLLVHIRNLALVIALAAIAAWRLRDRALRGRLAAYLTSAGVLVLIRTVLTHHLWGTWLTTPHARVGEWNGVSGVIAGSATGAGRAAGRSGIRSVDVRACVSAGRVRGRRAGAVAAARRRLRRGCRDRVRGDGRVSADQRPRVDGRLVAAGADAGPRRSTARDRPRVRRTARASSRRHRAGRHPGGD